MDLGTYRNRNSFGAITVIRIFLLAFAILFASSDVFAQRGGRSGGFSSSRSSSSSFRSSSSSSSKPSSSGWGSSSKPSSSKPSSGGFSSSSSSSSKSSVVSPPIKKSEVDNAAYKAAKTSGKAFTDQKSASSDFKNKYASKYTNKFDKEPATRPSYIPQSTNVGGQNVNITYNSTHGGYGYMHPTLGTWIMYDMMSDAVMMSSMMRHEGYYVGAPPAVYGYPSGASIFFTTLIIIVAVVVVIGISYSLR